MTNNDPKIQFNGMILLNSYLQRVFVAETIYHRLSKNEAYDYNAARYEEAKKLMDETHNLLPVFEETKELTMAQKQQLQLITEKAQSLMQDYFKQMPLSFQDKLALVGSTLYGEQMMNNGILRLGEVFNIEVNKDFQMRTKFYEDRIKMIDFIVNSLYQNKSVEEDLLKPVEALFSDVLRQKEHILGDMKKIEEMIGF